MFTLLADCRHDHNTASTALDPGVLLRLHKGQQCLEGAFHSVSLCFLLVSPSLVISRLVQDQTQLVCVISRTVYKIWHWSQDCMTAAMTVYANVIAVMSACANPIAEVCLPCVCRVIHCYTHSCLCTVLCCPVPSLYIVLLHNHAGRRIRSLNAACLGHAGDRDVDGQSGTHDRSAPALNPPAQHVQGKGADPLRSNIARLTDSGT